MKFDDFRYAEMYLSDIDCIACTFNGAGSLETVSNGSEITFTNVSTNGGAKYKRVSSKYDTCIEATFQICKNPSNKSYDEMFFTTDEIRYITSWLCRKEYHEFRLIGEGFIDIYFMASFKVSMIKIGGKVCGFELTMQSDKPFAYKDPIVKKYNLRSGNMSFSIFIDSDEEGYIYPKVKLKVLRDGDLKITNEEIDEEVFIKDCSLNEEIEMNYPMITTNVNRKIQNKFNWEFVKLKNTFSTRMNKLTVSLPCTIEITYSPIAKINL